MASKKTPSAQKLARKKGSTSGLLADGIELDDFVSNLDLSGNLTFLSAKPKKSGSLKK
ncbi:MAG: hypothetical protein WCJ16_05815 [Actinomycetes bacterium]